MYKLIAVALFVTTSVAPACHVLANDHEAEQAESVSVIKFR